MSENWTYAKAGVNIDKKSSAIESLVKELKYTRTGIRQMVHMKNLFASSSISVTTISLLPRTV